MTSKRKTAVPHVEHGVFTDELPAPTVAVIQTEEAFFQDIAKSVQDRREGRRTEPVSTVSFESPAALFAVLTPKRYELIEIVKSKGRFNSVEALATALKRDRATVSRDLKALADAGLLRVHEVVNSGHGKRSEISPVAERLVVELAI